MRIRMFLGLLLLGACQKSSPTMLAAPAPGSPAAQSSVVIENETAMEVMVFFAFGADSVVLPAEWSFCKSAAKLTCHFPLAAHGSKALPLAGKYLNTTIAFGDPVSCGSTKAELNLNNPKWYDITDISLVDGYSNDVSIAVDDASGKKVLGPPRGAQGNETVYGLFPLGCDICTARQNPPCGMKPGPEGCKKGTQFKPDVPCQNQGATMGGGSEVHVVYSGKH